MNHKAKNIIVALDFDGCIAYGEFAKIFHAKKFYRIDVDNKHIMKDTFPLGPEKYGEMMKYVTTQGIMEYALAPYVKQVLEALYSQGFRFAIVTSRHDSEQRPELNACKKFCSHHDLPISYFHNTNETPKTYIVKKLHARAIIDDSLGKLLPLRDSSLALYFLRQTWNAHEHISVHNALGIIPVDDWHRFYTELQLLRNIHEAICYFNHWDNTWKNIEQIEQYRKSHLSAVGYLLQRYALETKTRP